jgi:hypothetical protein
MKSSEFNKLSKEDKKQIKFNNLPARRKGCLIGLVIFIGLMIIGIINGLVNPNSNNNNNEQTSVKSETNSPLKQSIKILSSKYLSDYIKNEVKADNLYKDKYVLIAGIAGNIKKDFENKAYLYLNEDQIGDLILVNLKTNKNRPIFTDRAAQY